MVLLLTKKDEQVQKDAELAKKLQDKEFENIHHSSSLPRIDNEAINETIKQEDEKERLEQEKKNNENKVKVPVFSKQNTRKSNNNNDYLYIFIYKTLFIVNIIFINNLNCIIIYIIFKHYNMVNLNRATTR